MRLIKNQTRNTFFCYIINLIYEEINESILKSDLLLKVSVSTTFKIIEHLVKTLISNKNKTPFHLSHIK